MQSKLDLPDVVVIGGGIAGLAAAAFLARAEKRVTLLEQSSALGGRARTKEHRGFHLNLGPHALYRSGPGIQILEELGVAPRGAQPQTSGGFAVEAGIKYTLPIGIVSLLTTGLFGLSAKLETARLLSSLSKVDAAAVMNRTVREWLDENVSHPEVQRLILALFRVATYANAPDVFSAGAAVNQVQKALAKGVLYLDGGWQSVVEGLRVAARTAGVAIQTGTRAASVGRGPDGQVTEVRLGDGRVIPASTVIIAASPSIAASLVERGERTSIGEWAARAIPVKASCLDLGLSRLPKPGSLFALGIDRPHYLSVHSSVARLAPEGAAMVQLAKYLPPDNEETEEDVEGELERLMDLIQPGWRGTVVYRRFLPDLVVMNAMPTASDGGYSGRPTPEVPDLPGLYIVGDSVGGEGLLVDASLSSARRAAELIVARRTASSHAWLHHGAADSRFTAGLHHETGAPTQLV
jgi:phytoene dehydrogenase-like protein